MRSISPASSLRFALAWAVMGAFALSSLADPPAAVTYPAWWIDRGVAAAQPPDPVEETVEFGAWRDSNYQPANVGQLKHVAAQARAYLDDKLYEVGGAGPGIDEMIDGWDVGSEANYAPLNLGQLKAVALPFYERLQAVGFDTRQSLLDHGAILDEGQELPWPTPPPAYGEEGYDEGDFETWMAKNYQPANLGQVKLVFTFDLDAWAATKDWSEVDADGDGLPDSWEITHGLSPFDDGSEDTDNGPAGDPDEDSVSNLNEYNGGVDGTDPNDPVSGPEPPEDPPPAAPGGFQVQQIRVDDDELLAGHLYLRWSAVAGNITYQVQRRLPSGTPGVPGAWGNLSLSPNIAANVATDTDDTAAFPNWYQYRVRAVDGDTSLPSPWAMYPPGLAYVQPLAPPEGETDPEWDVPGYDDYDGDGLTNQEEFLYATDPSHPDSDRDGLKDGEDAFATQREFKLPRQPTPHYAVLDLGEGEVVDMNDEGDVLIKLVTTEGNVTTTAYRVWSGGTDIPLPETGAHNHSIEWARLGWDSSSNHTIAMGSTQMDFVTSTNATADVIIPVYCDVTEEEPEAEEPEYAELMALGGSPTDYAAHGIVEIFFGRDGAARWMVQHVYGSGGNATSTVRLATWGPAGLDTEDGPLTLAEDGPGSLTLTIASVPNGSGGDDTLTAEFTNSSLPEHHGFMRLYFNGLEIPGFTHNNIDGWGAFNLSYFRALADRFARWGDKIVLAPGVTFPSLPYNLIYQAAPAAPLQYMALPADPRDTSALAEVNTINSSGLGISGTKLFSNSKEFGGDKVFPEAAAENISITFYAAVPSGPVAGKADYTQDSQAKKKALALLPVHINPISTHSFKVSGFSLHTYITVANLPLNQITNPAIIVMGDSTNPAKLSATTSLPEPGTELQSLKASKLHWQLDTGYGLSGNVNFVDDKQNGREVQVYGTTPGRVRFSLWYNYGNATSPNLKDLSEVTIGDANLKFSYCKYEAVVADKLSVKIRAQRLIYKKIAPTVDTDNPGDWATLAPEADRINEHMKIANVILRQAGIELIWDTDQAPKYKINDVKSNTLVSDAIFDVKIKGGPNHWNYSGNSTQALSSVTALGFLVNNYRQNVVQVGYTGLLNDLSDRPGYAGGWALWGKATGRSLVEGKSYYAYITSLRDKHYDELTKEHFFNILSPYRDAEVFTPLVDDLSPQSNLYGLILVAGYKPDYDSQTVKYAYGQALAHEIGHILNLRHRKGYTHGTHGFDGLDEQPAEGEANTHAIPLGGYMGDSGTNVMDYKGGNYHLPEDIDLHQAIIMRSGTIF